MHLALLRAYRRERNLLIGGCLEIYNVDFVQISRKELELSSCTYDLARRSGHVQLPF